MKLKFHFSTLILGVILAFSFMIGMAMKFTENIDIKGIWGTNNLPFFIVLTVFFYILAELLNFFMDLNKKERIDSSAQWNFWRVFCILSVSWLLHLVITFPGAVYGDTYNQLKEFYGVSRYENSNPYFTTIIYGSVVQFADIIFSNTTYAVGFAVFLQTLVMSAAFSYASIVILKVTGSKAIATILLLWYAIVPIFGGAAQCLLKDSLHMALFVVYFCIGIELVLYQNNSKIVFYSVFSLLCALTRKGAQAYIIAGNIAVFLFLFFSARHTSNNESEILRKRMLNRICINLLIGILGWIAIYLFFELVLIPYRNIIASFDNEYYSSILQQLIYVARAHYGELTAAEMEILTTNFDLEKAIELYDPNIVDPIRAAINHPKFNPSSLLRLYGSWIIKYPGDILAGIVASYWKYVCPFEHANSFYRHYYGDFSVFSQPLHYLGPKVLREKLYQFVDEWMVASPWREIPVSCGLYSWMLMFSFARMLRNKRKELWVVVVPVMVLFVGLFMTHVNGEVRYAYPLIATAPLTLCLSCVQKRKMIQPMPQPVSHSFQREYQNIDFFISGENYLADHNNRK